MGKSQTKKKTQGWRHNPIRVPDSYLGHGKAAGQGGSGGGGKEGQLLPILNMVSEATVLFHLFHLFHLFRLFHSVFEFREPVGSL
jgi:hypothetical protein